VPTYTACGHTCIYTGSVPAITGIVSNIWWDKNRSENINSVQDDSVKTVGSNTESGQMSPLNLQVTTICDELKLATNFRSKVIGIALKDRSSILPAGHSADAAYWYDPKNGDWITSTYYMKDLPRWTKDFNAKKIVDKYYNSNSWNTLYPLNSYVESTGDEKSYENNPFDSKGFPYSLKQYAGKNYSVIESTPFGNSFTLDFARSCLTAEKLGADSITDFLAISLSSPDFIGHAFGPNSVEVEDNYLRLDRDLGEFLRFLDEKVGNGQYIFFLSADHGVSQAPGFLREHKIPTGNISPQGMFTEINRGLKDKFGIDSLVENVSNFQVYINHKILNSKKTADEKDIRKWIINYLLQQPGISMALEPDHISGSTLPPIIKQAITNGYNQQLSGDVQYIPRSQWVDGFEKGGTSHGTWNNYDAHVPLLWFGWNISPGRSNKGMQMTDIAPTLAALLRIQVPGGSIGHVIDDLVK
jgi:hypothetical protein